MSVHRPKHMCADVCLLWTGLVMEPNRKTTYLSAIILQKVEKNGDCKNEK